MRLSSMLLATTLAMLATSTLGASPYELGGFTTDLVFSQAVEKARTPGGNCRIAPAGTPEGGVSAKCEYAACSTRDKDGACDPLEEGATRVTIAAHPIRQLVLEAPKESAPLTRIIFGYEGRYETIVEGLEEMFGPPSGDVTGADQPSGTYARRLGWTQGGYRVEVVNRPKIIIMVGEKAQK